MKYSKFLVAALAFVLLAYFISQNNKEQTQETANGKETQQSLANSGSQSSLTTRSDNQGAVTVEVTPLDISSDIDSWRFEGSLSTHSVELNGDLVQKSVLLDDQGNFHQPISWEGAGPGGHHREGVLIFNAVKPAPQSVELKIKDIAGIAVRSFKWNLN